MVKTCNDYTELVGGPVYERKSWVPNFKMFAPINTGHLVWSNNTKESGEIDIVITRDILAAMHNMPVGEWSFTYNRKCPKDQEGYFDGEKIYGVYQKGNYAWKIGSKVRL